MRLCKWLLAGLLLTTGGTQPVLCDFRSHLSSPAVVLPDTADNPVTVVAPAPAATNDVSALLSNVVTHINKDETITQTSTQVPKRRQKQGQTNKVGSAVTKLVLRDDSSASSSSSEPLPSDPLLNEDNDILGAQENLSVGAMSSEGLDAKRTTSSSSSSNSPPPPKIPAMAQALLAQARQKQVQQKSQPRNLKGIRRHAPTQATTPAPINAETTTTSTLTRGVASITPIVDPSPEEIDTDTETEIEPDPDTPEITFIPLSRTISMSPFVRLSIATTRHSPITPRVISFGSNPLQQIMAELRASLDAHDPVMSMWRQSTSHGTSKVMRVFPIDSDAHVRVLHIHAEPSITQHPCREDAKLLCASEMTSHSMLDTMACLGRHESEVSDTCRHEIQHCPVMACAQDVQQLCTPQQRMTRSSVMECLSRVHDQLSQRCQTATGTHTDTPVTAADTNQVETSSSTTPAITRTSTSFGTWLGSASPKASTSVSASVVVGLTFLGFALIVLSCCLYRHLRKITYQPEQISMEHVSSANA